MTMELGVSPLPEAIYQSSVSKVVWGTWVKNAQGVVFCYLLLSSLCYFSSFNLILHKIVVQCVMWGKSLPFDLVPLILLQMRSRFMGFPREQIPIHCFVFP